LERGNDTLRNVTDENNNMKESIRSLQVEISGYQKQQSESDIRGMQQMKMQVEQYENRVRQYMK
jgi:DNA helicase IV